MTSLLELSSVSKSFGGLNAIYQVSAQINGGEILGLIGPNGSGKTTLFSLITGFLKPDSGSIYFQGIDITGKAPHVITDMGIGRTFQVVRPFVNLTVFDNVTIGALAQENHVHRAREAAADILQLCGLYEKRFQKCDGLPIADRKLMEIARALATQPKILLLDEVMAGLTPRECDKALELVRKIHSQGITLIIVEHVMKIIMSVAQKVIVLHHGQKIACDAPEVVSQDQNVIQAYLGDKYARTRIGERRLR